MNIFLRRTVCSILMVLAVLLVTVAMTWVSMGAVWLPNQKDLSEAVKSGSYLSLFGERVFWESYPGFSATWAGIWNGWVCFFVSVWVVAWHTMVMRGRRSYLMVAGACMGGVVGAYVLGVLCAGFRPDAERPMWAAVSVLGVLYLSIATAFFAAWELLRLSILCRVLKDAASEL